MDDLVSLLSWKEQYSSASGRVGSCWIGFGRLTHDRYLMALKTSLMRNLKRVKCCSFLKAQSGFGDRTRSATSYMQAALDSVPSSESIFMLRLRLFSVVVVFSGVVDGALHRFLQLDVGLSSG